MSEILLRAERLDKTFTLHVQGGVKLPVLCDVSLEVRSGECLAIGGASGAGKSTLMRALFGNYRVDRGTVWVRDGARFVDLTTAPPHELASLRTRTIGHVSQFLRVIPRVAAIDVAMEPLVARGSSRETAHAKVAMLFERLHLPERLWGLSPTTFSGGEKQRVNVARTIAAEHPILLLDEPTSALDARSRASVVELLLERKAAGAALVGIFHDDAVRERIADRTLELDQMVRA